MKMLALFLTAALCLSLCLMIPASAEESAEEPGTLKLNFAPEGEDPVKVILLKEI